mmetsp:Transcript_33286/g.85069  ORF Transcript_33286/g.85069 Transcript_33286/m.85069 type:complete len:248 (-) Transcript_33286:274-1017(-)
MICVACRRRTSASPPGLYSSPSSLSSSAALSPPPPLFSMPESTARLRNSLAEPARWPARRLPLTRCSAAAVFSLSWYTTCMSPSICEARKSPSGLERDASGGGMPRTRRLRERDAAALVAALRLLPPRRGGRPSSAAPLSEGFARLLLPPRPAGPKLSACENSCGDESFRPSITLSIFASMSAVSSCSASSLGPALAGDAPRPGDVDRAGSVASSSSRMLCSPRRRRGGAAAAAAASPALARLAGRG